MSCVLKIKSKCLHKIDDVFISELSVNVYENIFIHKLQVHLHLLLRKGFMYVVVCG